MSNIAANAEIDARHAKEPETEFCLGLDYGDACELFNVIGDLDCEGPLTDLFNELSLWLDRNGYT